MHPVIKKLKREMDSRGISVAEMSRRLRKASPTGLYEMFRGEKTPTLTQVDLVAGELGVELCVRRPRVGIVMRRR